MEAILVLIHTLPPLISVFNDLAARILPGVSVKHILDEPLLEIIRQQGGLSPEHAERLYAHVKIGAEAGAKAILVTCSTISPLVDSIRSRVSVPVFKIDAAMMERAVQSGREMFIIATNPTTLKPTRLSLMETAIAAGKQIQVSELLVVGALDALLSGDGEKHDRLVRDAIRSASPGKDVVLLAQASMARVMETLPHVEYAPLVLSSPYVALEGLREILLPRMS